MTSLSDRAGFLIVASLIKYAVGFVMPMVLVRLLSQSDYGSYQQMVLIGTAAVGIMTFGLPTSIYYFYHQVVAEKLPALIAQTTILLSLAGLLALAGIWIGADYFAATLNNPSVGMLIRIYACSLLFLIGSEHCLHFMISENKYGLAVTFEVAETFVRVITLLIPIWMGFGLFGLIIGIVSYSVLRFFVRNIYLIAGSGLNFSGWRKHAFVHEQVRYSLPIAMVSLSGLLGSVINRGMLATSFTPSSFAIYAVGALEIPLDVIFQASVANVLRASLPPLVRDGNLEEVVRIMREAVRKLSMIVLPSFIFLLGHAYQFITLLFTSNYAESVPVFKIYLWLVPLHMLVLSPIPQAFGKPKLNFYIVFAMTALLIVLGYILLKTIGFYGPAIAAVSVQYVQVGLYFVVILRLTKSTLSQLMPFAHIVRVILAGTVSLLASFLVDSLTGSALANLIFSGAIFSIVFSILAFAFGICTADDKRLIKRWCNKVFSIPA